MMINLYIRRNEYQCNTDCTFLDADFFDRAGTCLLFKETLKPEFSYGNIDGWQTCNSCDKVAQKAEELATDND